MKILLNMLVIAVAVTALITIWTPSARKNYWMVTVAFDSEKGTTYRTIYIQADSLSDWYVDAFNKEKFVIIGAWACTEKEYTKAGTFPHGRSFDSIHATSNQSVKL
jgi:hypothetical protein